MAVPSELVTVIAPLLAPGITKATIVLIIELLLIDIGIAETPPIVNEVSVLKLVPEIVTKLPTEPLEGAKLLIMGAPDEYTQKAPLLTLSAGPPTIAVPPSALIQTEEPWVGEPPPPVPTNLLPIWLQTPALRVNSHAAP